MENQKSPFDAAIRALKIEMETDTFYNQIGELWSAIHILEAAGKVDKHSAICSMRHSNANEAWSGLDEDWATINALLACL